MKYLLPIILIIIFPVKIFAAENLQNLYASTFFSPEIIQIENVFKSIVKGCDGSVVYTIVPRGLIVSVAQSQLFDNGKTEIRKCGFLVLNAVIQVMKTFNNKCVIESHTDETLPADSPYKEDWEVTIIRANKIADYLVKIGKIPPERIFPLGFGEYMPFNENVSKTGFTDSRIDFVIIDYELNR